MHTAKLLLLIWSIGLFGWIFVHLLRRLGVIQVSGYESWKFKPDSEKGLVILFRHPSIKETVILPLLFFLEYCFHPSQIPYQTPDSKLWLYKHFPFFRNISIPVERGNVRKEIRALKAIKNHLCGGGIILTAPEGGRTWKGKKFKYLKDGRIQIISKPKGGIDLNTPIVRRFKRGSASLLEDGAPVLIVWVEPLGRWGLKINIGPRHSFDTSFPKKRIPDYLENMMLYTAVGE